MKNSVKSDKFLPTVFVTAASAGSGKTYCLAKHYLKLLLSQKSSGREMEEILAITFTNKACREMKERILDFLKQIALDEFISPAQKEDILSSLPLGKDEARLKAGAAMDKIITNYNFFQVKTIDSFINTILLGCSYQIGLSSGFEIRDDKQDYLILSLDTCIENAGKDKEIRKIFDNFIRQYIYLEGKNSWLPKKDILGLLGSMFYHANIYGNSFKKLEVGSLDLYKEKQELLGLYRKLLNDAPEGLNGTFRNTLAKFVQDNPEVFDFSDISSRSSLLKDILPMRKDAASHPQSESLWKEIRSRSIKLAQIEASTYFNCYIDIFSLVYEYFRSYAKKDDALFLDELNHQAKHLIQQNGITVPELYYHLAGRLRHYLIDEFQDTSLLQWQNLFPMVEEAISSGGSLFYVGDKKQAIFRFRGGDVSLFDKTKDDFQDYACEDFLTDNYRSAQEIVEFNNLIFGQENLSRFLRQQQEAGTNPLKFFNTQDLDEILSVFSGPLQKCSVDKRGLVRVEMITAKEISERDELIRGKVLEIISGITRDRRFARKNIAILCRGNDEVEKVSAWLIQENIPVESEKTLNIKNNKLIKELLALLSFLSSPIDNLSFSAVILGELFLRSCGLEKKEMEDFLFGLRSKIASESSFYIYREFRRRYPQLWKELFEESFNEVGFIGLYELVADIFSRFKVFVNFSDQQGFFMHFLQSVKESEEDHPGIFDFLEYFSGIDESKLFVNSSGADAVRLMTIHKAKGLGLEVAIIPFLYLDINELGSQAKKGKVSYVVESSQGLSLLRLDSKYALLSELIADKYRQEYKKEFIDELNAIYVALTRAKSELYIFFSDGISRMNNVARFLIPPDSFSSGNIVVGKKADNEKTKTLQICPAKHWKWNEYLRDEFNDKSLLQRRQLIREGELLHQILAGVGNLQGLDKEALQESFSLVKDFSKYQEVVERLLEREELRDFFYVEDGVVLQEKEVVDDSGRTYRIDRLIIKDKEVWVIDYKSSAQGAVEQQEQVRNYMKIIQKLYPQARVRGFLLYLDLLKAEEVHG